MHFIRKLKILGQPYNITLEHDFIKYPKKTFE